MGTDGGTDTSIEQRPGRGAAVELDVAALDVQLERVVDGLRLGDLAFVVTAAVRLGPAIAVCLAAAGAATTDERVSDVAFALADLTADRATASWSPGELLAAAVAQVAAAPHPVSGPTG